MTYQSPFKLVTSLVLQFFKKEVLMENRKDSGSISIRFNSRKEAVDLAVKIELKYFMARLLFVGHAVP